MTKEIKIKIPQKIKVIGVGGSGQSAINRMISSQLNEVNFIVVNTDKQALVHSQAPVKIQIGQKLTKGRGTGGDPLKGARAIEEGQKEICQALANTDLLFITCGEGGGTGTGAAPIIAQLAGSQNILTVGVVTKPFSFEGKYRQKIAELGIAELKAYVDTLIVIPNDRLIKISDKKTSLVKAFQAADEILTQGIRAIVELLTTHGIVNVDFADIKSIMSKGGLALMGVGQARGDDRAVAAAKKAISSPLFESPINGARGILINITGDSKLGMYEINDAVQVITAAANPEANIIFGAMIKRVMEEEIKITVIATGIE